MYNTSENQKKLFKFFLLPVLILLAGAWVIISTVPKSIEWSDLKNNGTQVEAQIYSIRKKSTQYGRTTSTVHCAYVKYTYEGTEYSGELNVYSPEMLEGSKVTIMVSRDDPHKFMAEPKTNGRMYFMGTVIMLAGGFAMFMAFIRLRS